MLLSNDPMTAARLSQPQREMRLLQRGVQRKGIPSLSPSLASIQLQGQRMAVARKEGQAPFLASVQNRLTLYLYRVQQLIKELKWVTKSHTKNTKKCQR